MVKNQHRTAIFFLYFCLTLNLLVVLLLLGSYASLYIDPREAWIFALFGLLYPYLLIINILFILLWLILWKKYAWISLIAIAIGWKSLSTIMAFNFTPAILPPVQNFSLITYNIHNFNGHNDIKRNVRGEITEFIAGEQPDILCLQEFSIQEADGEPAYRKMMTAWHMPYRYFEPYYKSDRQLPVNGIATFSKHPIIGHGFLGKYPAQCFGIFTDITFHQDTVRIFNIHLASVRLNKKEMDLYNQLTNKENEKVLWKENVFNIVKKLKRAFLLHSQQLDQLMGVMNDSPYPVVICGDLNDTPISYTYRKLTRRFKDVFREAGKGFLGNTYAGFFPPSRIDYIFHDRLLSAYAYRKMKITFSDHYPVYCLLVVEK